MVDFFKQVEQLFLYLDDTPNTYSGIDYIFLKVNETKDGLIFGPVDFVDIGITSVSGHGGQYVYLNEEEDKLDFKDIGFLDLLDTPTTYSGNTGKGLRVKSDETGLEYVDFPTSSDIESFYAISESESSTTSTDWQEKLKLTFTPFSQGNYVIHFSADVSHESAGVIMKARLQLDDTYTYRERQIELYNYKHSDGAYNQYTGMYILEDLSAEEHTLDMDYCSNKKNKAMYIKSAHILVQRMSN